MKSEVINLVFGEKMSIEVDDSVIMLKNRNNTMSFGMVLTDKDGGIPNPLTQSIKVEPSNVWEITKVDNVIVYDENSHLGILIKGDGRTKHHIDITNDNVDNVGISLFGRTPTYNKSKSLTLRSV